MAARFPGLYVILDAALCSGSAVELAERLASAGAQLLQYRDKGASARRLHQVCASIASRLAAFPTRFVVNDRADVAALVGAGGVHVGQEDLPLAAARAIVGPDGWIGCSTHTLEQVRQADSTDADYIAFGPIFPTTTKAAPDPVVGIEGLRQARALTHKPLVAIGGIRLDRAEEVWRAGADSVAVAGDVLSAADPASRVLAYRELESRVFPGGF
jgi:thiamine-phosphate pyrophosphorylase